MSTQKRTLTSLAALAGFVVLATGSSPQLAEELSELSEDPYEDPYADDWGSDHVGSDAGPISASGFSMESLRGRQIWVVNSPDRSVCRKFEAAGMIVECDPDWEHSGEAEIVIWCTEIPHVAAQTVLDYAGLSGFNIRTHQTNSSAGGLGECGELFEITLRYVD